MIVLGADTHTIAAVDAATGATPSASAGAPVPPPKTVARGCRRPRHVDLTGATGAAHQLGKRGRERLQSLAAATTKPQKRVSDEHVV
jgi:hypothetical protein